MADAITAFVLDEQGGQSLATAMELSPRWQEPAHLPELTRALILVPGERVATPPMRAPQEPCTWLKLARGLPRISDDGLDAELWLLREGQAARRLAALHLDNADPQGGGVALQLSLPLSPGEDFLLELRCGPGPQDSPDADWLAVAGWVVGEESALPLLRARAQGAWRLANELAHFASAYEGDFYRERRVERGDGTADPVRSLPTSAGGDLPDIDETRLAQRLGDTAALPGENAFRYTHRLLRQLLPPPAPDFAARLRDLHARAPDRPVRMLSLCAGEAAVEGALLARAGVPVALCLVDVSSELLERAAARMPAHVEVDRVLGSASDIGPALGEFDVVNITSGLHHLVELERVLAAIAAMLAPDGEFWLIGEQVGRNGNRLWPEALAAANAVFRRWPAAKRRNAGTGAVDEAIPDKDFSSASFEGIRSQDIEALIGRHFLPLCTHLRDAFLWRLVDAAYAGNFDLQDDGDRRLLQQAVLAEARHWLEGGRGTALNGAWRAKRALLHAPPPRP